MLPKGSIKKLAAVGLAAAAIAPAAAVAHPASDGSPAGGTPAATVQDLRAPDQQVAPATTPDQPVVAPAPTWPVHPQTLTRPKASTSSDLRAPDQQVAPATTFDRPVVNAAPTWPVHPQTLTRPKASASSDGGLDTGAIVALACLGLAALLGAGYLYRLHVHGPRRAAA